MIDLLLLLRALKDVLVSLLTWPFAKGADEPVVFHDSGDPVGALWLGEAPSLSAFTPCPWARGPWAQTILGQKWVRAPRIAWWREWVPVPVSPAEEAGDEPDRRVALDWSVSPDDPVLPPDAPVAFCTHGLDGSSASTYMRALAERLGDKGWRVVVYNRGTVGRECPRYVEMEEVHEAVEHALRRRFPGAAAVVGLGVSAGANLVVKYAAAHPEHPFDAIVSVANAHDIHAHAKLLVNWPTANALLSRLASRAWRATRAAARNGSGPDRRPRYRSVRAFDAEVTCPHHGYPDVESYHKAMSSHEALERVAVPMLSLASLDDPLIPASQVTYAIVDAERRGKRHILVVTARGGHVGFVTGWLGRRTWMVDVVSDFADFVLRRPYGVGGG